MTDQDSDLLFATNYIPLSHIIDHLDMVLQYLRSPWRSRQYSMKLAGGRLYSNAILYCLHSVHDAKFHGVDVVERQFEYSRKYLRSYDQRDRHILLQWIKNGSQNMHEDNWRGATDTAALDPSNYLESLQTVYEDDPSIHNGPPEKLTINPSGRKMSYFIGIRLLQVALYCFPRAGRCDKLLHICNTKYPSKNGFSLEDRKIIFRAMEAYVDRWKDGGSGSPENDEWAYPFPLVEKRVSIFTDEEKEAILKLRAQTTK